jgi:uncharacterized SAM-binding protein YcdF (DUF218 family)
MGQHFGSDTNRCPAALGQRATASGRQRKMAFDDEQPSSLRGVAPVNQSRLNTGSGTSRGFISVATVLLLVIVAAVVAMALEHARTAIVLGALAALLFLMIGNGPLARWLASALQAPAFFEKPREFGGPIAIILLGDGSIVEPNGERLPRWLAYSRIECAARLYHSASAGGSPTCVIVTGDDTAGGQGGSSMYADRLRGLGVRAEHIKVEGRGRNTYRQAELTAELVRGEQYDHVFLVTSGLHMKRALRYFSHFGVHSIGVACDYVKVPITPFPRGENFAIAEIALHQYVGLARLRVYNAFGLNKPLQRKRHSAVGTNK